MEGSCCELWALVAAAVLNEDAASKTKFNFTLVGPEAEGISSESIKTVKKTYHEFSKQSDFVAPDAVVLFNPGLTCEDYNWKETLQVFASLGAPLILTSGTLMECSVDCEILEDDHSFTTVQEPELNEYGSLNALQSGTLAPDCYFKNKAVALLCP